MNKVTESTFVVCLLYCTYYLLEDLILYLSCVLIILLHTAVEPDPFALQERFARNPLKMDTPEKVLSQAHGQVRPIVDFLHENGNTSTIILAFYFIMSRNLLSIFTIHTRARVTAC